MGDRLTAASRGVGCGLGVAGAFVGGLGTLFAAAAALGLLASDRLVTASVGGGTAAAFGLVLVVCGGAFHAASRGPGR